MRLTSKGEYALIALLYLIDQKAYQVPIQVKDIARKQKLPLNYMKQLCRLLKKSGILYSNTGYGGGYTLAAPASTIQIKEVFQAIDNKLECERDPGTTTPERSAVSALISELNLNFKKFLDLSLEELSRKRLT